MSDLISRKPAIDALDKQIKQCCKALGSLSLSDVDKHAVEVEMASLRAYREMLENLPTVQPEPPWTPCERKMPEEPGYYLTSNEYCSVSEDFYYDGHFSNADKNAYKVIAWMPKPESYKPIEDDFRGVTVYDVPPSEELTDEQVIDYCRKKGYKIVADYLFNLLSKPEPQWIPVSERLPEDMQFVLLTVRRLKDEYNHEPFISVGYIGWNQQHWWCAHDGDCEISKVEVIAWMPLPEPYKPNK